MVEIEQIIDEAKQSAKTDEQKRMAEVAFIVYAVMRIRQLQNHVSVLEELIKDERLLGDKKESFNDAYQYNKSEIMRLQIQLKLDSVDQIDDVLKRILNNK